ncbi:MAG: hypothetical protein MZW92_19470 [Comamonadaceae bacterium]|nr:hypothetical protein [Comamonadaceae bacterium]
MALALPTIAGNHERQLLGRGSRALGAGRRATPPSAADAGAARLAGCAAADALQPADGCVCCHGTPASDLQYLLETVTPDLGSARRARPARGHAPPRRRARSAAVGADACCCAATPTCRALCGWPTARLIVNPGSVGLQAFDDDHPQPHGSRTAAPHARWALVDATAARVAGRAARRRPTTGRPPPGSAEAERPRRLGRCPARRLRRPFGGRRSNSRRMNPSIGWALRRAGRRARLRTNTAGRRAAGIQRGRVLAAAAVQPARCARCSRPAQAPVGHVASAVMLQREAATPA